MLYTRREIGKLALAVPAAGFLSTSSTDGGAKMAHGTQDHGIPGELVTHTDRIPVYGAQHTICATTSGAWADPRTWDKARAPNATDAVCVPSGLTVTLAGTGSRPRPPSAPSGVRVVMVTLGGTASVASPAACLDLVIAGMLQGTAGFDLTVRTITVLPSGTLQLSERGRILFRDGVIDTTFDPAQYGHGLIVVDGTLTIDGQAKTPWAALAAEIHAGDTTLQLAAAPQGWQAGDRLVLPDTRQPAVPGDLSDSARHTERVTVQSVSGTTVMLTALVRFDHFGWRNQQGVAELLPDVGNLTRSIVFASENPAGTRAHVLLHGRADVTARYVELRELGRTRVDPLHSTTRDAEFGNVTRIGTNQIGRYAWHFHHCLGPVTTPKPYQFEATGLAIAGSPKWGIAVHNSHYGYVGHNVVDGAKGGGIVTETVSEYASVIEQNLIVGAQGSAQRITDRSHRNDPAGDFWHGGVGLGLASASCTIRGNRIYAFKEGIGMAGFRTTTPFWPAVRGADPAVNRQPNRHVDPYYYPFEFPTNDNLVWSCWRGIETWTADSYPDKVDMFPGLTIVHCKQGTDFEDQTETTTKRWRFLGDFTQIVIGGDVGDQAISGAYALGFKDGYEFGQTHEDGEYRGYPVAYRMVFPTHYTRFYRCTFECPTVVFQPLGQMLQNAEEGSRWDGLWQDCTFLPVNGHLTFVSGWYPKYDIDLWLHSVGTPDRQFLKPVTYQLRPWRDGRHLNVYHWWQAASYARPPITAPARYGDFPPGVSSNAQLIARGTPIFGAVKPDNAEPFGQFFFASAIP